MNAFFGNLGILSNGLLHLSAKESYEMCLKGAAIVDVREDYLTAFKQFKVPEVIPLSFSELDKRYAELPTDKPLIVADATGLHSKEAARLLTDKGFKNIANLAGGMVEWDRDLLPLITNQSERLTGPCMCQLKPKEKKK